MRTNLFAAIVVVLLGLSGCANMDRESRETVGTVGGAVVGGVVGDAVAGSGGAIVGGATGAYLGNKASKR